MYVHEAGLYAVERQGVTEQVRGTAVDGLLGDDVLALPGQRLDRVGDGRRAACDRKPATPPSSAAMRCSKTPWVELVSLP